MNMLQFELFPHRHGRIRLTVPALSPYHYGSIRIVDKRLELALASIYSEHQTSALAV
jgi:hypothetical protein